jgi:hypothetical protein
MVNIIMLGITMKPHWIHSNTHSLSTSKLYFLSNIDFSQNLEASLFYLCLVLFLKMKLLSYCTFIMHIDKLLYQTIFLWMLNKIKLHGYKRKWGMPKAEIYSVCGVCSFTCSIEWWFFIFLIKCCFSLLYIDV